MKIQNSSHFHFNFKKTGSWLRAPLSITRSLSSGKPYIPSFATNLAAASFVHLDSSLFPEGQRWSSAMWIITTHHMLLIWPYLVFLSCGSHSTFNFLWLAEIAPHWGCVAPAFLLVTCLPFWKILGCSGKQQLDNLIKCACASNLEETSGLNSRL